MTVTQASDTLTITSTASLVYSYIHVVQQVTTTATTVVSVTFTSSVSTYTLTEDGYYVITEIKAETENNGDYYITGGVLYDSGDAEVYNPDTDTLASISTVLAFDYTATSMTKITLDHISYYELEAYYIDLLQNKFLKGICGCTCTFSDATKQTIDTLMMGLAIIQYMNTYQQYNEAQRVLENLSSCVGLTTSDCGCYD